MRLTIDGTFSNGVYRVDCECGTHWSGRAHPYGAAWSPALPIAEATVHVKLNHEGEQLELRFLRRFEEWLEKYWEWESLRQGGTLVESR
jgi:hypothetical protein